jgi:hypothetical protein
MFLHYPAAALVSTAKRTITHPGHPASLAVGVSGGQGVPAALVKRAVQRPWWATQCGHRSQCAIRPGIILAAEQFRGWMNRSIWIMRPLQLRQIEPRMESWAWQWS